ncbi:MAG TPA: 50S ribosomal protein L5 [Candidatus Nanoarchaeia archaeon]|nr:50S ribosomal protein L5 [Candidatus Nanoarchaeia archaeon]
MNKMKEIKIEKVTLNIGVGGPGDKLNNAMKLLNSITGLKAVQTSSNKRIPTWGVRPKLPLACMTTVRGKKAEDLLKRLLIGIESKIYKRKIDMSGNFSFGIEEYISIPGVKYDPAIGVIGLEVAVTLARPGFRIKNRSIQNKKIPARHRIKPEETLQFLKTNFGLNIAEEE